MSNMSRWDPLQDVLSLREAMQQLIEDSVVTPSTTRSTPTFAPAMDISETKDGFIVEAAVPGFKPEQIDVTFENNVLVLRGEVRKEETEAANRNFHRIERRYGSFQRSITLPSTINAEAIRANLEDGVLRLEIPKAEAVKPRKIAVGGANSERQIEVGATPGA